MGVCVCVCMRVFEEKHISLLLLPPSLFFLPADLHSRWVGFLLLPVSVLLRLPLSPAYSAFSPLRGTTGKIQPRTPSCSLFTRASPREIAWPRPAARKNRGNGAHLCIKHSPSVSLFISFYDRAAIAAPALT